METVEEIFEDMIKRGLIKEERLPEKYTRNEEYELGQIADDIKNGIEDYFYHQYFEYGTPWPTVDEKTMELIKIEAQRVKEELFDQRLETSTATISTSSIIGVDETYSYNEVFSRSNLELRIYQDLLEPYERS